MCVPESQVLCEGMDSTSGVLCLDVVHLQAVVLCLESGGFCLVGIFSPIKWSSALSFAVMHSRMQFSVKSECIIPVPSCTLWEVAALKQSLCQGIPVTEHSCYWPAAATALSCLHSSGERGLIKKSPRRMWHFDKRINSGALPQKCLNSLMYLHYTYSINCVSLSIIFT